MGSLRQGDNSLSFYKLLPLRQRKEGESLHS